MDLAHQFGQHGGLITRAGADFENAVLQTRRTAAMAAMTRGAKVSLPISCRVYAISCLMSRGMSFCPEFAKMADRLAPSAAR